MDSRKTRIVGALALATAAAIVIQEGRGISPGLSHCLAVAAFVAAMTPGDAARPINGTSYRPAPGVGVQVPGYQG